MAWRGGLPPARSVVYYHLQEHQENHRTLRYRKRDYVAYQPPYHGDGNLSDQRRSHRNPFQDARTHEYPHHADLRQNHPRKGKSGHGGTFRQTE